MSVAAQCTLSPSYCPHVRCGINRAGQDHGHAHAWPMVGEVASGSRYVSLPGHWLPIHILQALFNYVAEQLSGKGLAYLHIIEGDTSGLPIPPFDYKNLKRLFGGLVIANNGFDKPRANKAIADGRADLIAFGKPSRARRGSVSARDLWGFEACDRLFSRGGNYGRNAI